MTSAEQSQPSYADRVFRSPAGIAGGVLLLVVALWLGLDALIQGSGRTQALAVAGLFLAVPLIFAFTMRPAVFAGEDRIRIRNPFRLIVLPWATVKDVRAGYSTEVFTQDGRKFPVWAIPVSLRQRKRAQRRPGRRTATDPYDTMSAAANATGAEIAQAIADRSVSDLRELARQSAARPGAQGVAEFRWAYEIIGPAVAGLVALIVLFAIG